jgi:hypothetical protein
VATSGHPGSDDGDANKLHAIRLPLTNEGAPVFEMGKRIVDLMPYAIDVLQPMIHVDAGTIVIQPQGAPPPTRPCAEGVLLRFLLITSMPGKHGVIGGSPDDGSTPPSIRIENSLLDPTISIGSNVVLGDNVFVYDAERHTVTPAHRRAP